MIFSYDVEAGGYTVFYPSGEEAFVSSDEVTEYCRETGVDVQQAIYDLVSWGNPPEFSSDGQ
jgi:hypothetical protein